MRMVALHKVVPNFTLPATGNQQITLSHFRGKPVVIYFYPKDCTSGCTRESVDFRENFPSFRVHNTVILGISRDTVKLHEKFKADHQLPFPLLSDSNELVCEIFGVMQEKIMYGRKVRGIERSTFLIDANGILQYEWRKVKVEGHVRAVLEAVQKLPTSSH